MNELGVVVDDTPTFIYLHQLIQLLLEPISRIQSFAWYLRAVAVFESFIVISLISFTYFNFRPMQNIAKLINIKYAVQFEYSTQQQIK